MRQTVAVFGGTGFIGRQLCIALAGCGADVRSVKSARSVHEHEFATRTTAGHGDILCHEQGRRRDLTPERDAPRTGRQIRRDEDGTPFSGKQSEG